MRGKAASGAGGQTAGEAEGSARAPRLERGRGALGPALELVHTGRAPTRAVLTAELGVTRATAGAVAAELEALGLIRIDAKPSAAAGSQGVPRTGCPSPRTDPWRSPRRYTRTAIARPS